MSETNLSFAFVVATLNGAQTVAKTVEACAAQADTYLVSDGSRDETVNVALLSGAKRVKALWKNVGKPSAIYRIVHDMGLLEKYDLISIVDDDTIIDPDFVEVTTKAFKENTAIVCAKTRSDWNEHNKWNPIVANRAFGYWKYQAFIRKGQSALGVMNCISGSNSVYRSELLEQVLIPDTPYCVDDSYWLLETQRRQLGKIVYEDRTSAKIQEPLTVRSWYKQNLRWLWGTFQGIRGHKVGRRATWFDVAYIGMMIDWFLYVLLLPAILCATIFTMPEKLDTIILLYLAGYLAWATIGAIALKKWRLIPLFPTLIVMDFIMRVNFIHAVIKTVREPTVDECKWDSPERMSA